MNNNASMEEVYKAEVECLRKELAEKDKESKELERLRKLEKIVIEKVDANLALLMLFNNPKIAEQAEKIRLEYNDLVNWEK